MGLKEWLITEVKWVERWQILLVGAMAFLVGLLAGTAL